MSAEDLVTYPRSIGGVKVAVLLREEGPGIVKASLRGKDDVPSTASRIASAAAVTRTPRVVRRGTLDEATAAVLAAVDVALDGQRLGMSRGASGILPVDKGPGATSFQVVAHLRRMMRAPKIGHGGTLDPDATGVLPILIGEATKLTPYLIELDKEYVATVRLGIVTDTEDLSGAVLETPPVPARRRPGDRGRAGALRRRDPAGAADVLGASPRRQAPLRAGARGADGGARGARGDRSRDRARVRRAPRFHAARAMREGDVYPHAGRRSGPSARQRRRPRGARPNARRTLRARGGGRVGRGVRARVGQRALRIGSLPLDSALPSLARVQLDAVREPRLPPRAGRDGGVRAPRLRARL